MKFLHLSDLHLGKKLLEHDLREDQEYILREIVRIARTRKPDAVVIAGDIYDKAVPSAEAVELFDHFVSELAETLPETEIMMISGNHDSAMRLNVFRNVLGRQRIHMIGLPPETQEDHIEKVVLSDEYGPVNFYLLPFVKPSMVRQIVGTEENGNSFSYEETLRRLLLREEIAQEERNVLVSHQFYLPAGKRAEDVERTDQETVTVGNIDAVCAEVLQAFDYAALGHIHKPMEVGSGFFRYCGSPLPMSVSEAGQEKGIIEVEMRAKGDIRTEVLPLVPLRQVRVLRGTLREVLPESCSDYVSVRLSDRVDLDILDMQDRLRHAFPNLLEVHRESLQGADYRIVHRNGKMPGTYELCREFLKDPDEEEQALLKDVINAVQAETGA